MTDDGAPHWTEDNSLTFLDVGRYFVPDREIQIQTIARLIPERDEPFHVLELGCGEGLLAAAVLAHHPQATLHGYDGSEMMLARLRQNLEPYEGRFTTRLFNLVDTEWRTPAWPFYAVVSSLVIHHLDNEEKAQLYRDIYGMLEPGGVFVIADLVQPAGERSRELAADAWDDAVRQRAQALDGNTAAYERFRQTEWNLYRYPDPMDKPSTLFDQLRWLAGAGFKEVDVYWMKAGHAIFGGRK